MPSLAVLLLCALLQDPAPHATGDEVRLSEGGSVRGTIVKETREQVFVDIGPTIVALPRARIEEILRADAEPLPAPEEGTPARPWVEVDRQPASVRENVERVGAGVVLVRVPGALGSGFVTSADGWVVTNAHVVQGERNISVTFFEGTEQGFEKKVVDEVELVAVNPYWDVALLRLPGEARGRVDLRPVPFGSMDELTAGDAVFAIGSPLGLERSVSEGIVSTTNRENDGMLYVQTTAAVNPGNSGGPLLDDRGRVVGVTTWGYLGAEGLNFAIPVSTVKTFLENRDAFAFDKDHPNSGYRYLRPPRKGASPP